MAIPRKRKKAANRRVMAARMGPPEVAMERKEGSTKLLGPTEVTHPATVVVTATTAETKRLSQPAIQKMAAAAAAVEAMVTRRRPMVAMVMARYNRWAREDVATPVAVGAMGSRLQAPCQRPLRRRLRKRADQLTVL